MDLVIMHFDFRVYFTYSEFINLTSNNQENSLHHKTSTPVIM
jgi:hypothetical protein